MNRWLSVNPQALGDSSCKAMLVEEAEEILRHIYVGCRNVRKICLTS
ncbi:hypothetical protein HDC96_001587 [Stenotrophomonas sp. JAI102]|nr:hypothetical protein [Stenotrophomonas sp. JAI102]